MRSTDLSFDTQFSLLCGHPAAGGLRSTSSAQAIISQLSHPLLPSTPLTNGAWTTALTSSWSLCWGRWWTMLHWMPGRTVDRMLVQQCTWGLESCRNQISSSSTHAMICWWQWPWMPGHSCCCFSWGKLLGEVCLLFSTLAAGDGIFQGIDNSRVLRDGCVHHCSGCWILTFLQTSAGARCYPQAIC